MPAAGRERIAHTKGMALHFFHRHALQQRGSYDVNGLAERMERNRKVMAQVRGHAKQLAMTGDSPEPSR